RAMLEKTRRRGPPPASAFHGIVGREPVPVGVKITMILKKFLSAPRLRFRDLFAGARNRSEIVATFLAVLELSKTRRVLIDGEGEDVALELTEVEE
ncbi:MAG: segregation/condensation protein A, partial [Butyricicoccus sp.]